MIDPLSALGVIGNILQVIDFGFRLVYEANELHNSTSGALEYNEDAEDRANQLTALTEKLTESQDTWLATHGNVELDPNEIRLRYLCERCGEIAVELKVQLRKLKVQNGTTKRRFHSYKQALLSVWRKDQIDAIAFRLEKYQREIDTHILVGLRRSTEIIKLEHTERFTSLDKQTQDLMRTVLSGGDKLSSKLDDQRDILDQIRRHTNQLLNSLNPRVQPQTSFNVTVPTFSFSTPLHKAAESGDVLTIRKALRDHSVDVNARDSEGCTPLHIVRTADAAKRLLAHPHVIKDVEDNGGRSALHCAVLKRRLDVVKALLEAGFDQDLIDDTGKPPSFYARDCPAASWMLQHGPDIEVRAPAGSNWLRNTGLIHMAWLDDLEGVEFFLSQGANVNAQNDYKETALLKTARNGRHALAALLLARGAGIEIPAKRRRTPLLQAVRYNRVKFVDLMIQHGANMEAILTRENGGGGNTALVEACTLNNAEIAKLLAENGANVHATDDKGRTSLMLAVANGKADLVEVLLKKGANVEARDKEGASPLSLCITGGHSKRLQLLLDYAVDVNVTFSDGCTALGTAARVGNVDCCELLVKQCINIDAPGIRGHVFTALAEACVHGHIDVAKVLLKNGAKPDAGSATGFSPVSLAALYGHQEIVELLLSHKVDVEQTLPPTTSVGVDHSMTPLMHAAAHGHESIVKTLIDHGAKLDTNDLEGRDALHHAALHRHHACAQVLLGAGASPDTTNIWGETALMAAAAYADVDTACVLLTGGADIQLKDQSGRTAWHRAMFQANNENLERMLDPATDDQKATLYLQAEQHPSEIAARMNLTYR